VLLVLIGTLLAGCAATPDTRDNAAKGPFIRAAVPFSYYY
jgi:hypothetical protein